MEDGRSDEAEVQRTKLGPLRRPPASAEVLPLRSHSSTHLILLLRQLQSQLLRNDYEGHRGDVVSTEFLWHRWKQIPDWPYS